MSEQQAEKKSEKKAKKQPMTAADRRRLTTIIIVVVVVVAVIIGVVAFVVHRHNVKKNADLAAGVSYLENLENRDTDEVEDEIKKKKAEERKAALNSEDADIWKMFNDSVIMGDSRAVGFSYYKFLDQDRVLATSGATIRKIPEWIDDAKKMNPSTVYLVFGINDTGMGFWKTPEAYIKEYEEQAEKIQEALPKAQIYIVSIIPATDPAFEKSTSWKVIPEWNKAMKAHFVDTKIRYIDITDTVNAHKNLYDADGIHMQRAFYPYWAKAIIAGTLEYED